jgi:DNA-binding SARP family transcriptional activator/TolB-like protein
MIEIQTLGRTVVTVDGEHLTGEAAWPKSLALLVYMAREPGPDRREGILGVLWPDRDEKRARRALNQLVYTLRKVSPQLDLESVEDALDFGREFWLDVDEFERRLEAGDLRGAVELYKGPFLVDLGFGEPEFDHWADRQREGLRRKFRKAALELATEARANHELDEAIAYCRQLLEADPLDDEPQHLLIDCLYLRGDRVAALRQYDVYRELLTQELEVEPLEHTRELVARIRAEPVAGEAGAETRPDPGTATAAPGPGPVVAEPKAGVASTEGGQAAKPARRRWLVALGAVAAAVILAVAFWPGGGAREPLVAAGEDVTAEATRVAVLPFQLHGFGSDDGLPEGVAQLLALNLDGRGSFQAVTHRRVLQYWETTNPDREMLNDPASLGGIAGELGATSLVLGDLHASGDQVRIVAELVGARSGAVLARADVRGPREGLFDLLDEVARALVQQAWPQQGSGDNE